MSELKNIKDQVESRLQEQQKSKEFKDVGRVAMTRKEMSAFKLINGQILNLLEEDAIMAHNMVKKENVWPEIDVEAEKGRGVSAGATYLKVKMREAVPTRPKDEKAKRATFVLFLELLQKDLIECYTVAQIKDLTEKYREMPIDKVIGYFIDPKYLTATPEERAQMDVVLKRNGNIQMAMIYGSRSLVPKLVNEVFSARFENTFFNRSDASRIIWFEATEMEPVTEEEAKILSDKLKERKKNFIEANEKNIAEYKAMDLKALKLAMETKWTLGGGSKSIYKQDMEAFRTWVISYYERNIKNESFRYDEKIKKAVAKGNDWSWTNKSEVKDEVAKPKSQAINTKTPLAYIKRTGGYKITANTPQEIVSRFGFSAVNYGNYVDDKWSKEHTAHFLSAVCDMAEMLNIDIKKMNQLGGLSIAFGAKGRKGHLATYFPQTKDINLTKGNGDGSVAHEWGHYFDNVIVEMDLKRATNEFGSQHKSPDPIIRQLFRELMDFFYKGYDQVTPTVPMQFYAQKSEKAPTYSVRKENGYGYDSKPIQIKATIEETLEQLKSFMRVDKDYHSTQVRLFGYVIDAFGLESYNVPMKLRTSYFFHKSAYNVFKYCYMNPLTKRYEITTSTRTAYWTSDVELFARAWETVMLKKILDKGRVSNYLVNDIPLEDIINEGYSRPYPAGKELDYIETMIDKIVVAVKSKFAVGDFIPPSNIKEDEYVELKKDESGKTKEAMVVETRPDGGKKVEFVEETKVVKVVKEPKKEAMSKQITMDTFIDIVKSSANFEDAFKLARELKGVPADVATAFSDKYNPDGSLSMEQSFRVFWYEVMGTKPTTMTDKNEAETGIAPSITPHKGVKANVQIAIKEVLALPRFKDLKEMEAGMLYNLRNINDIESEVDNAEGLKLAMYNSLIEKMYIDVDYVANQTILTDTAKDFISTVDNRLETRRGIKAGYDMFPETANIPELNYKMSFAEYLDAENIEAGGARAELAKKLWLSNVKEANEKALYDKAVIEKTMTAEKVISILNEAGLHVSDGLKIIDKEERDAETERLKRELIDKGRQAEAEKAKLEAFKKEAIIAVPTKKEYSRADVEATIKGLQVLSEQEPDNKDVISTIKGLKVLLQHSGDTLEFGGFIIQKNNVTLHEFFN